ncbi:unnamed protein product, partial [Mesorhabditis spiculigera]
MAPLRSFVCLLLLGLCLLSSVLAFPRNYEKRAMRNSLVRFGKRSELIGNHLASRRSRANGYIWWTRFSFVTTSISSKPDHPSSHVETTHYPDHSSTTIIYSIIPTSI